jgi:guanine deaminase
MESRDILIKDVLLITSRSDKPVDYLDARITSIRIKGAKIDAVGPCEKVPQAEDEEIPCGNGQLIAMPGFVDAHNHSRQMAFQAFPESGWKDPQSLPKDQKEMSDIFKWFLLEALKAGVTFVCDWPEHPDLWDPAPLDQVLQEIKLRSCIRVLLPHDREEPLPDPHTTAKKLQETFDHLRKAAKEEHDMIQLAIWVPQENSPEFNRPVLRFLGDLRWHMGSEPLSFQMHLAESEKRRAACERALDRLVWEGLIRSSGTARTVPIHAIWIDDKDLSILAERKDQVGVVICPKFSDGRIAPVKELLSADIPVGLGSDASVPDPFKLIRDVVSIHKSREASNKISFEEAFYMATLGGAKVFGLDKHIGSIEEGKDADIVLVKNPAAIHPEVFSENTPRKKRIEAIRRLFVRNVIRREHVHTVIVRGEKLVNEGKLCIYGQNEDGIANAGREAALRIMKRYWK